MIRTWRTPLRLALLALLLPLAGCLPASLSDDVPDAVVVNAPYPQRVPGAADVLLDRLREEDTGMDVVDSARARFLESRSGLVGRSAPRAAGGVAADIGADVAVGVAASLLERALEGSEEDPAERVTLRLEAFVVTADGEVWERMETRTQEGRRFLAEAELPDLDEDPLLASLRDDAVAELAPQVRDALRVLNAELTGERVGIGIGGDGADDDAGEVQSK